MKNTNRIKSSLPVYLNNAATSFPKSPGLGEEVARLIESLPEHPGRSGSMGKDILDSCRHALARLINLDNPNRMVLCKNSTEALNIAIRGLGLKDRSVVTSAMEHNSVLRPLYQLQKEGAIKLEIVPCDRTGRVDRGLWQEKISRYNPKLVVLNHASNVTGAVNPVEELLGYARNRGCVTLLDASQTLGLLPLDIGGLPVDLMAFTGHKYLLGPAGTGGLYVGESIQLQPVFSGGTGTRSDLKEMPREMPVRLEPGTPAMSLFGGLLHSLQWQEKQTHSLDLLEELTRKLENGLLKRGARVIEVPGERTFTVSFNLPGWELDELGYLLRGSFQIVCRTGLHCAPLVHEFIGTAPLGTVRLSLSRFTRAEEIDYVLQAIGELNGATA